MTRVNVVDPAILTRQHVLAEHREIVRIPNSVKAGKLSVERIDGRYRLGKNHVKFFTTRLLWLYKRYLAVHRECLRRGYNVTWMWPEIECHGDYTVSNEDVKLNLARLRERDPEAYQND